MKGFTIFVKRKDIFIETDRVRKTKELAKLIIRKLNETGEFDIPDNQWAIHDVLHYLQKAECEIKTLSNGKQYYEIHGENFGGKGSFVDDGNTVIIHI